jgi:nitroreductase
MDFMELVRKRRSIRRFRPDPVSEDDIIYILEAARLAPSWANTQCWHFVVVTDERVKQDVTAAASEWGMKWIARAPVIVVACADPAAPGYKGDIPNYLLDIGIAVEHLVLAATDRGLATCWVGGFDEAGMKQALGVPENMRVVAVIPVGHPDQSPAPRSRKSLDDISSYNRYHAKP